MKTVPVLETCVPTLGCPALAQTVVELRQINEVECLVITQSPNEEECPECGSQITADDVVVLDYATFQTIHDELKLRGKI